ncbi:oligosaccharide biosynthesis protein Alg14 like-domain-containing protein [Haematococcus lacustris]
MVPRLDVERGTLEWDDLDYGPPDPVANRKVFYIAAIVFACILLLEFAVMIVLVCFYSAPRPKRVLHGRLKTLIVLGSGGHTAEMLRLVAALDKSTYAPRVYVTATNDTMSGNKAMEAEKAYQLEGPAKECELYAIPRSREVGQSYFTSVFTSLNSCLYAASLVWQTSPDIVIVNGPGTCIPLCGAAFLFSKLFVKACDIVYVESIARTRTLSLSGKILYHSRMARVFLVQWEQLAKQYRRAEFAGRLY